MSSAVRSCAALPCSPDASSRITTDATTQLYSLGVRVLLSCTSSLSISPYVSFVSNGLCTRVVQSTGVTLEHVCCALLCSKCTRRTLYCNGFVTKPKARYRLHPKQRRRQRIFEL